MARRATSTFVDKEKKVLNSFAKTIGSTLGQVAALGQTAKKARSAEAKPARRRSTSAKSRPNNARRKRVVQPRKNRRRSSRSRR